MTILDSLLSVLRAHEQRDTPHLERSSAESVSAVADWLRTWTDPEGKAIWKNAGDGERRRLAADLLRLRERFAAVWRARGGR